MLYSPKDIPYVPAPLVLDHSKSKSLANALVSQAEVIYSCPKTGKENDICLLLWETFCVFLNSVLVYLFSINQRAKLTIKIVYISPVTQLAQACEDRKPNQLQLHAPKLLLYLTLTCQARARYQTTRDEPCCSEIC